MAVRSPPGGAGTGLPVVGGLNNSVLFVNPAGTLAQDNTNFTYTIGTTTFAAPTITAATKFLGPNGSTAAPTYSFSSAATTGWFLNAGSIAATIGGGAANFQISSTAVLFGTLKVTQYNSINTAGQGLVVVAAAGRVTAQAAANASISTYTVGAADGSFEVSGNLNCTVATALSTTMTCTYTDESNVQRVMVLPVQQLTGSFIAAGAITGTGAWESPVMHIRAKAATTITIGTTAGTFTGVTYTAEGIIKQTA